MKTQSNTQSSEIKDVNRNIMDCWQLVKISHQKKKKERENRRALKNKS
jgi:hypothetical protein